MQKIKFIGYSNDLIRNKIIEQTIVSFANKSGFKVELFDKNSTISIDETGKIKN